MPTIDKLADEMGMDLKVQGFRSAENFALDVVRPITHPIETVGARLTLVSMQSGIG
jgi:hypothetical protein